MRFFLLAALSVCLSACGTTSNVQSMRGGTTPPAASTVLVVAPDIQLAILTAAGTQESRADWSAAARENVANSIAAHVRRQGHTAVLFEPDDVMEGRSGQILRLHEAVANTIGLVHYTPLLPLPTKRNDFAWTLGDGVQELAAQSEAPQARYAMFIFARGSFASGGRMAAVAVGAVLGVGVPMGGQTMYASLVDLQTGNIVWFNVARAGSNDDMREDSGADALIDSALRSAPL